MPLSFQWIILILLCIVREKLDEGVYCGSEYVFRVIRVSDSGKKLCIIVCYEMFVCVAVEEVPFTDLA